MSTTTALTEDVPCCEEIARTHAGAIYRHALRLTRNRADAEDLQQDVLVRVVQRLDASAPGNVEAWIHRITVNLFLDGVRRRRGVRIGDLNGLAERLADTDPNPADLVDQHSFDADIEFALDALAPEYRDAVIQCDVEGRTYGEIALSAGVSRGTIASRIHRGRRQLRAALVVRAPRSARS